MAGFSTPRGLFGAPMMGDTPLTQQLPVPTPEVAYKRPSTGQMIAGTIGDALQNWSGGRGTFLPGLQQQQEAARQARQYQQQRADEYTDWERKQAYGALHPTAQAPTEFERSLQASGVAPGTPQWTAAMAAKVANTTDPQVVVPLPNGTYIGPKSGLAAAYGNGTPAGGGGVAAPKTLPHDFDFGGAGQQAPRTFR